MSIVMEECAEFSGSALDDVWLIDVEILMNSDFMIGELSTSTSVYFMYMMSSLQILWYSNISL